MSDGADSPHSAPDAVWPSGSATGRIFEDQRLPWSALVVVVVAVVVAVASQMFPDAYPLGVALKGALLGSGTGLMAVGLVLIYRTTRVINFAYGAIGSVGAGVAVALKVNEGWRWSVAAPLGVLIGVLLGALVERLVIRRFARAPRLVLTVATIGLAQLLGGIAIEIPDWIGGESVNVIPGFETQLSEVERSVDPVLFNGNDLLLLAVVPVVLILLSWFLLRTEAGIAVRGMAENMDRARLLGIPVNRLSLLLWAVAGGLAALTVTIQAPNTGLPFDVGAGPALLLPALAAAVVSGMRSLTWAFVAGVGLGVLDQLLQFNFSDQRALTMVVFLGVIVAALLLQRRNTSRALAADESSWITVATARKLPARLTRIPEVRVTKVVFWLGLAAVLWWLPRFGNESQVNYATVTLVYGIAALSLVVLTGWGGVVSLGQVAIVGVGGVVAANLIVDRNTDLFLALAASAVAGGLVALVVGLPALRVSGQFLAVTTLAFAVAMDNYVLNPANFESLLPPNFVRPQLWGEIDLADEGPVYRLTLVLLVLTALAVHNLRRARAGRSIAATRDNPRGVAAVGINSVETRLAGFVFAGMFAGLAGALHAVTLRSIGAETYPTAASLLLFSMAVIGGASSIGGTLAGVVVVQWLGYVFPEIQVLMTGVGLLVILWLLPGGLGGAYERVRDPLVKLLARRRGIPVVDRLETIDQSVDDMGGQPPPAGRPDWAAPAAPPAASPGPVFRSGEMPAVGGAVPLLTCEGVESSYGSLQVLFGIDAQVSQGELLALLGTNGAGKSTLLRSVSGLLPPHGGRVVFADRDITGMSAERIARQGLSLMPGGKGVFPTLTVAENLRLATWMMRRRRRAAADARRQVEELFPILRERRDQLAGDLSGGEQQQLSLAMAFVTRPKLLCIDELSLGLAPTVVGQLVDKVKEIHASGTSVVVVEQSVNVALLLCERAVFLEKGQVRFRGPTAGLLERPDVLRAVFLGGADDLPVTHPDGPDGSGERPSRGVALECRGLTKRFGGIRAVDGVDLYVPPASIVGLIGHNGAGKTTLFDVISGFLPADGGQVILGGKDVTRRSPHRRAIAQLGRSFQEARLYPSLTVTEALMVAQERHLLNRDPLAAAMHLPVATMSEKVAAQRAAELVELLGLEAYRDHPTAELSTGTRRIVELGCLLAHDPAVVLLDEPSAGIAQRETEALGPLLRRVQQQTGCSLVVIEHDMGLLGGLCDTLVALEEGSVIAGGPPDHVLADHRVVSSYLGTEHEVVQRSNHRRTGAYATPTASATGRPPFGRD